MTLARPVAWLILGLAFFTAGLLRQHHDRIPASPYVSPVVGSLLFAAVFLLLLVAARERRLGALREHGVRVGSLTPILLILLVEKWVSMSFYNPAFSWVSSAQSGDALLDAQYRAFAGMALLTVCVLLGAFSPPAGHRTWRRSSPARWPAAAFGTALVIAATYLVLSGASAAMGGGLHLAWPTVDRLWLWVVIGQALRAFSEEVYYRGLLLAEMERLAPRLGMHAPSARRWTALVPTALLFSLEHVTLSPNRGQMGREAVFTFSLGLLLGILVMVTNNLHFAAGLHAYVNWLLLGAAPRFLDSSGQVALPPGTYVGLALVLAFVLSFFTQRSAGEEAFAEEGGASLGVPPQRPGADPPCPGGSP